MTANEAGRGIGTTEDCMANQHTTEPDSKPEEGGHVCTKACDIGLGHYTGVDDGPAFFPSVTPFFGPCIEGGEHCFCVERSNSMICCWCESSRLPKTQRVTGHGPYRTELVSE